MRELFHIGGFSVGIFGIMVALGMVAGILVITKETRRKGMDEEKTMDLVLYTVIASIIGARLYYVTAFRLPYYLENPLEILRFSEGGLSIQGGILGGILFAAWYARRKGMDFWKAADAFAPGIALGQAIGRIGCDVFGVPMQTPYAWGILVGGQLLHPAQLYEMGLDLILFLYLWRKRGRLRYRGELFIHYLIGFSLVRFLVEFFRTNPIAFGPFTVAHVTSLVLIAIAAAAGLVIRKRNRLEEDAAEQNAAAVPWYHYALLLLLARAGIAIYYLVNANL
jgi:phosphatidylglycerol:prolipoprotein diacylglycerol transferase